jgi:hypothetical protein
MKFSLYILAFLPLCWGIGGQRADLFDGEKFAAPDGCPPLPLDEGKREAYNTARE